MTHMELDILHSRVCQYGCQKKLWDLRNVAQCLRLFLEILSFAKIGILSPQLNLNSTQKLGVGCDMKMTLVTHHHPPPTQTQCQQYISCY